MEKQRKWWKFYLLPAGSTKEISKRGAWIAISSALISALVRDGVAIVFLSIITCYGLALLVVATMIPLFRKIGSKISFKFLRPAHIYLVLALAAVIFGGYWLLVRPGEVRAECSMKAGKSLKESEYEFSDMNEARSWYDLSYIACLRKAGIKG